MCSRSGQFQYDTKETNKTKTRGKKKEEEHEKSQLKERFYICCATEAYKIDKTNKCLLRFLVL